MSRSAIALIALQHIACSESQGTMGSAPDIDENTHPGGTGDNTGFGPGETGGAPTASSGGGNASGAGGRGASAGVNGDAGLTMVPLFDDSTELEPAVVEETDGALITRFADRARDRHAREAEFQAYEHYLPHYWEHRTAQVEIVDTVGRGEEGGVTFHVTTEWKLKDNQEELRCFYRGIGTVAEYHDNRTMTPIDDLHYTHRVENNPVENRALELGDRMECELSQFLDAPPRGRDNYYGTVFLYVMGEGLVPWAGTGERRDSERIPDSAWTGGSTTLHRNESDEPDNLFMQMATNIAPGNAQPFMLGRRLVHTDFVDGSHDESDENPMWSEQVGKAGPYRINHSCNGCHDRNGRAAPPEVGESLDRYVFRVGDAEGNADPLLGAVLQPTGDDGPGEGAVRLAAWEETDGLRRPIFEFDGASPERHSARISPQLVGLGLLEAIPEATLAERADPDDVDGNGISGRLHVVTDYAGVLRLGRFGWKAGQPTVRQQVAAALRTDLGVLTSVYSTSDCGADQTGCGASGAELDDTDLDHITRYVSLLGVQPQRDYDDPTVLAGQEIFESAGCAGCHTPTLVTSDFALLAELRAQTIHPYTDLLLHDMGPGLADTLGDGEASGSEWRTPPLWSIGLTAGVTGAEAYLHDGRARTLTEAILWHGGEGEAAKNAFVNLSEEDRSALLAFVESL